MNATAEARPLPTTDWAGIRYFDSRPTGAGRSVVLVHGLGNSLQFWVAVAPPVSEFARVIAMDIPGFGKSRPPRENRFDAYVDAMAGLLRHLDVEGYHVVGHSMGSVLASAVAADARSTAASLTFLDGIPFGALHLIRSPLSTFAQPALALNLTAQFVGGAIPLGRRGARLVASSTRLRQFALWPFVYDSSRLRQDVVAVALEDNGGVGPARAACLARCTPFEDLVVVPRVPVRVMRGEHDRLVSPQDVELTVEHYGAVDQVTVEGTGHWPLLEAPEQIVDYIESFI